MLLSAVLILAGLFCWYGTLSKASFFWDSRKAQSLRNLIGDLATKVIYLVLGLVIIGCGLFLGGMKFYESRADKLYDQGQYQEGLNIYYDLHKYMKDDINYLNGVAFGNYMTENYEEAEKYAQLSVDKNKKGNQDGSVLLAWSLNQQNKLSQAINALTEYLDKDSDNKLVHSELGSLYYSDSQYDKAAESYNKAIELDPTDGRNYLSLAEVYYQHQKFNDEIAIYNRMIENSVEVAGREHDETYKTIYYNLGVSYYSIENYQKAEESFAKAVELDKGDADGWYFLASSQALLNKPAEVLKSLEEAFKLNREYVQVVKTDADFSAMLQNNDIATLIKKYSKN